MCANFDISLSLPPPPSLVSRSFREGAPKPGLKASKVEKRRANYACIVPEDEGREVVRSRSVVGEGGRGEQRHLFSGNCLKPGATGW